MIAESICTTRLNSRLHATVRIMAAAAVIWVAGAEVASAYVGKSFLQVPGVSGDWKGEKYKGWVSAESNIWQKQALGPFARRRRGSNAYFSYPSAPRKGASEMTVAIDKRNPALPRLMDRCLHKASIPEMTYAESSVQARPSLEIGSRPADIPEYYEYRLKDVQITDCPVVADASEQPLVISFKEIEWLNFHGEGEGRPLTLEPAVLAPAKSTGMTRTYVVAWFAPAHDVGESINDQCPVMYEKPGETEYYALMSKEDAAKERIRLAPKGGPTYPDSVICMRGPHQINVCGLPGIVKDPVQPAPATKVARGLNLDGNDGTGASTAGTCKHKNYVSEDGREGIDNQLYTVEGCMRGYQGHKGQLYQYANEQRRSGMMAILLQINGIDDEKNDDSVDITLLYSLDPMEKNAAGDAVLSDVTFRITDRPELASFFTRLHGRIVNGVLTTDPVKEMKTNMPLDTPVTLHNAQMRLEFLPDGSIKGVLGGYQDWRHIVTANGSGLVESLIGTSITAMYGAFKRAADGFKDPVTGECNEISSAYDVEGVPAFLPPDEQKKLLARADAGGEKAQ
jgi:hypothetical protein